MATLFIYQPREYCTLTFSPTPDPGIPADLATIADERACERLIINYTHLVDSGNASAIADLFTPDGTWRTDEFAMEGQDAIRSGFGRRQGVSRRQSRHVCTNIAVSVNGDSATAVSYLINYRHDSQSGQAERPAPAGIAKYVGEYYDQFTRTEQGWRFSDRLFAVTFLRPSSH